MSNPKKPKGGRRRTPVGGSWFNRLVLAPLVGLGLLVGGYQAITTAIPGYKGPSWNASAWGDIEKAVAGVGQIIDQAAAAGSAGDGGSNNALLGVPMVLGGAHGAPQPASDGTLRTPVVVPGINETKKQYAGRVVKVSDGDTVTVLYEVNGQPTQMKVRLANIDAPESKQAFGERSRQHLAGIIAGKNVVVSVDNTDQYGRSVGTVILGRRNVNREMVEAGMAWAYVGYMRDREMANIERQARAARRGLWQDRKPKEPWEWRKEQRNKRK